jgi:hypothetical protein
MVADERLPAGTAGAGTLVVGVHAGYVDTDLAADIDAPKILAGDVAEAAMTGLLNDEPEARAAVNFPQVAW